MRTLHCRCGKHAGVIHNNRRTMNRRFLFVLLSLLLLTGYGVSKLGRWPLLVVGCFGWLVAQTHAFVPRTRTHTPHTHTHTHTHTQTRTGEGYCCTAGTMAGTTFILTRSPHTCLTSFAIKHNCKSHTPTLLRFKRKQTALTHTSASGSFSPRVAAGRSSPRPCCGHSLEAATLLSAC